MIGDKAPSTIRPAHRFSVAQSVAECILAQIHRPYPCSASQVLHGPGDLQLPADRFPVFYGSFDWHSCVHSHWSLVRLLAHGALDPDLAARTVAALARSFRSEALAREAASWEQLPEHTERPYGLTWLLALDAELARPEIAQTHPEWRAALQPLVGVLLPRVRRWVQTCALPVRSGMHSDTAWSLAVAWDWASRTADKPLLDAIAERARALYLRDVCAPCAYEPSGETFTSPILNEAALMARALGPGEYDRWMRGFLPQAFEAGEGFGVQEGPRDPSVTPLLPDIPAAWDGTSYLGVHEVALPLARCIAARDAAAGLSGPQARAYLAAQAARWERQGLDGLVLDGYLADHWVGSFVVAAIAGCGASPFGQN